MLQTKEELLNKPLFKDVVVTGANGAKSFTLSHGDPDEVAIIVLGTDKTLESEAGPGCVRTCIYGSTEKLTMLILTYLQNNPHMAAIVFDHMLHDFVTARLLRDAIPPVDSPQ